MFYENLLFIIILLPYLPVFLNRKKRKLLEERKWQLNIEFRDGVISLSSALNAGYSIENAFSEARKSLLHMYSDQALIVKEFEYMINEINMNKPVEEVVRNFGVRTGIEDINNFSEVFITAKRTGGDIIKIIKSTGKAIGDRIEVKREIATLVASKKFESGIMSVIPFAIIVYMRLFSKEFLSPLYNNIMGILIMTIVLIVYIIALIWSHKIVSIEI